MAPADAQGFAVGCGHQYIELVTCCWLRRPYAPILLDEVEKAHPNIFDVLLQVLDDRRFTDGQARIVDFRDTVIVITSNLGSDIIQQKAGEEHYRETKAAAMEVITTAFRLDFIVRSAIRRTAAEAGAPAAGEPNGPRDPGRTLLDRGDHRGQCRGRRVDIYECGHRGAC